MTAYAPVSDSDLIPVATQAEQRSASTARVSKCPWGGWRGRRPRTLYGDPAWGPSARTRAGKHEVADLDQRGASVHCMFVGAIVVMKRVKLAIGREVSAYSFIYIYIYMNSTK